MKNIFLIQFKKLGLTYPELGEILQTHKGTAFVYVNNPARSGIQKSLEVGKALGLTEDEIKKFWVSIKKAAALEKIKVYNNSLTKPVKLDYSNPATPLIVEEEDIIETRKHKNDQE